MASANLVPEPDDPFGAWTASSWPPLVKRDSEERSYAVTREDLNEGYGSTIARVRAYDSRVIAGGFGATISMQSPQVAIT